MYTSYREWMQYEIDESFRWENRSSAFVHGELLWSPHMCLGMQNEIVGWNTRLHRFCNPLARMIYYLFL